MRRVSLTEDKITTYEQLRNNSHGCLLIYDAVKVWHAITKLNAGGSSTFLGTTNLNTQLRRGLNLLRAAFLVVTCLHLHFRDRVCSNGGMIRTGKVQDTRRKTTPSVNLSRANTTRTGLGSNSNLRCDSTATNRLFCCTLSVILCSDCSDFSLLSLLYNT